MIINTTFLFLMESVNLQEIKKQELYENIDRCTLKNNLLEKSNLTDVELLILESLKLQEIPDDQIEDLGVNDEVVDLSESEMFFDMDNDEQNSVSKTKVLTVVFRKTSFPFLLKPFSPACVSRNSAGRPRSVLFRNLVPFERTFLRKQSAPL